MANFAANSLGRYTSCSLRYCAFSSRRVMSSIRYWQVDAFTVKAFQGNPADVVYVPSIETTDDQWLQAMAAESHLPISTFITPTPSSCSEDKNYSIRWFTPTKEIELCGHGTIAAAHVLYNELQEISPDRPIHFQSKFSGKLRVQQTTSTIPGERFIALNFPNTRQEAHLLTSEDIQQLAKAFNIIPEALTNSIIHTGKSMYDVVLTVVPSLFFELPHDGIDFGALSQVHTDRGIIFTTNKGGDSKYDFYLRMFLPKYGINEDHVSGSAFCAVAQYWHDNLNKQQGQTMLGRQHSKRGGDVIVGVNGNIVVLAGRCVTTKLGQIKS